MSSFRLDISDTTSEALYPENRPNNFKVYLNNQLDFIQDDWEVALLNISYPTDKKEDRPTSTVGMLILAPNLVIESLVSESTAPILELIPVVPSPVGQTLYSSIKHPLFKRVSRGYINTFQIEIRDYLGQPYKFHTGSIKLTLLFRKCQRP